MTKNKTLLVILLLYNGIRFRFLKRTGTPVKPQALSVEITHRCIAKCVMCNIWKIPQSVPDLSINQWLTMLSSDLFSDLREMDITGGEPFVRKDLAGFLQGICVLKKDKLKSLKSIAITTNGLLTKQVLSETERMLPRLKREKLDLVVVCAMDAIGGIHDMIRNHKNAWIKVNETVEGLTRLREKYENLIVGLKTTVLPINIDELENISKYASDKNLFTIISPCIITPGRYLNTDKNKDFSFSREDKKKLVRFYSGNRSEWSYHTEALIRYLKTGAMKKPCTCGFNYFFLRSSGEMFLCPLIDYSIGNITKTTVSKLYFSKAAKHVRRNVRHFNQCRECTEPGLERYSLPFEGVSYLRLFLKLGPRKFTRTHRQMGLNKYL